MKRTKKQLRLLKLYDRIIDPVEKKYTKLIYKFLSNQAEDIKKAFLKHFKEKKSDGISKEEAEKQAQEIVDNIEYSIDSGTQTLMEILLPLWINAAELGNQFLNNIQFTKPADGTLFSVIREDYLTWLKDYGAEKVVGVNQTTKDITKRIIRDGLIKGDSTSVIADNLVEKIKEYSKKRAITIVNTEAHNSFSRGNFMSANANGFKYKTYITAGDSHVRPSHKAMNNQKRKINEKFSNGGMYPGDPNLPARETILCRCILFYS